MEAGGPSFVAALANEAPRCTATVLDIGDSFTVPDPVA
jgi:hypothetical protein